MPRRARFFDWRISDAGCEGGGSDPGAGTGTAMGPCSRPSPSWIKLLSPPLASPFACSRSSQSTRWSNSSGESEATCKPSMLSSRPATGVDCPPAALGPANRDASGSVLPPWGLSPTPGLSAAWVAAVVPITGVSA